MNNADAFLDGHVTFLNNDRSVTLKGRSDDTILAFYVLIVWGCGDIL